MGIYVNMSVPINVSFYKHLWLLLEGLFPLTLTAVDGYADDGRGRLGRSCCGFGCAAPPPPLFEILERIQSPPLARPGDE